MKRILVGLALSAGLVSVAPQSVQAGWRYPRPVIVRRYYTPPVPYVYRPGYVAPPYWYYPDVVIPPPVVVGGWW